MAREKKPRIPLNEEWRPSDRLFLNLEKRRPDLNLNNVFTQFQTYWMTQEGDWALKANWESTFRNWVVNQPVRIKNAYSKPEKFDPTAYVNRGARGGLCN